MTTTLRQPDRVRLNGQRPASPDPGQAPLSKPVQRNRNRIALGLIIIALSVLGVVAVVSRGAAQQPVLAVATHIPAGAAIEASDLTAVELPLDLGLPVVPAEQAGDLVGQRATVALQPGTLLNQSHLSNENRIPDGMALLGAVLDPGQYPVDLRAGDTVRLIETTPPTAAAPGPTAVDLGLGEVREIAEPPTGASALVVSLLVAVGDADAVAAAGAEGRISLVVIGSR